MRLPASLALVALMSLVPAGAGALPTPAGPAQVARGELHFPMTADEFRRHVEGRERHARKRLEDYITSNQVPQADADQLRARFAAGLTQVDAKVNEVCADGTVTQEEGMSVAQLARELLHHPTTG